MAVKETRGARLKSFVIAGALAAAGMLLPFAYAGSDALNILPVVAASLVVSAVLVGAAFTVLRPPVAGAIFVLVMALGAFLLIRSSDPWPAAAGPWLLGSFAGAVLGGRLGRRRASS